MSITRLEDGAESGKIGLGEDIFGPLNSVIHTFRITGQVRSDEREAIAEGTVSAFLNQAADEDAVGELSLGAHLTGSSVKVTFTL